MNKLSFETVEKLFKNEYPTGVIFQQSETKNKYSYEVAFKKNSKCYNYIVKNNIELISKLKLNINLVYNKDYNRYLERIAEIEAELKKGFYIDDLFGDAEKVEYTETDIKNFNCDIEYFQNKIKDAIII